MGGDNYQLSFISLGWVHYCFFQKYHLKVKQGKIRKDLNSQFVYLVEGGVLWHIHMKDGHYIHEM
jgi:hypothetical protein